MILVTATQYLADQNQQSTREDDRIWPKWFSLELRTSRHQFKKLNVLWEDYIRVDLLTYQKLIVWIELLIHYNWRRGFIESWQRLSATTIYKHAWLWNSWVIPFTLFFAHWWGYSVVYFHFDWLYCTIALEESDTGVRFSTNFCQPSSFVLNMERRKDSTGVSFCFLHKKQLL